MENLEIIVNEHILSFCGLKVLGKKKYVSTVGWKFKHKGEWYGDYITFNKSRLRKKDVIEATNALLTQAWQCFKELEGANNG